MADVNAVFGTLLTLGIAFPGMMLAWGLLFPGFIERAQGRVLHAPWKSIGLGLVLAAPVIGLSSLLLTLPAGLMKITGLILALGSLFLASVGASALCAGMGARWRPAAAEEQVTLSAHLLGAIALELAAVFPVIGWFVVIPLTILGSLGAAGYALFRPAAGPHPRGIPESPQLREA